jgi:hypothetical protein
MMVTISEAQMMTLSPFLSINCSCDQALPLTKTLLSGAGLSVVQTFNLNTSRLGVHECSCSHHGTDACDCQMIVLLVYGKPAEPVTLILHGNNGQTWVSVTDTLVQRTDKSLLINIRQALERQVSADP